MLRPRMAFELGLTRMELGGESGFESSQVLDQEATRRASGVKRLGQELPHHGSQILETTALSPSGAENQSGIDGLSAMPECPPLTGRQVQLRAVVPGDYPILRMLEMSDELGIRWRLRGGTPGPGAWEQGLWAQVLAQFMMVRRDDGQPIGIVSAYRPDFQNGHAYIAAARFRPQEPSPLVILGVALFLDYVFDCWDFRKLYMELPEFNMTPLASAVGRLLTVEGRMRKHEYFRGRYWDKLIVALYRDSWARERGRFDLPKGRRNDRFPPMAT